MLIPTGGMNENDEPSPQSVTGSTMNATDETRRGDHDTLVIFAQLAGIGLFTFAILLMLALLLPGAS